MRLTFIAAVTIAISMIIGSALPLTRAADSSTTPSRSIAVTSDGSVQVVPDVAYISVGVLKTDIDAERAQSEANVVATASIAAIKAQGIADKDLQTSGVSLQPQYDDHGTLTGFQASDTLSITVRHLNLAGAVIDAAVHAGANNAVSVTFGLLDPSASAAAALKVAVAAAQQKAMAVASQLGFSLAGAKVQVVENSSQTPQPVYFSAQRVATNAPVASPSTPIQAGTLTVQDNVTLTYSL